MRLTFWNVSVRVVLTILMILVLAAVLNSCAYLPGLAPRIHVDISGGPTPLSPQQMAAWKKMAAWDSAGAKAYTKGEWARAAADYRAETQVPHFPILPWTWCHLGEALVRAGQPQKAYAAFRHAAGNPMRIIQGDRESSARLGLMCADRGLYGDACECYYSSRTSGGSSSENFLPFTLNTRTTPHAKVRGLLEIMLGTALARPWLKTDGPARAAFREAIRLMPTDPRPRWFLAEELRQSGQFAPALAMLQEAARVDVHHTLQSQIARSASLAHSQSRVSFY